MTTQSELYSMPGNVGRAIRSEEQGREASWGRDELPVLAYQKAVGEAIERAGMYTPFDVVVGRLQDFDSVLHPHRLIRFSAAQYRRSTFPFKPFESQGLYQWTVAEDFRTGRAVQVLAQQVFVGKPLRDLLREGEYMAPRYCATSSSGCAAGLTLESARLSAVLELVERDAFMRHWLMQEPGVAISHESLPAQLQRRIAALESIGCTVTTQVLPSPFALVVFVAAQSIAMHFTSVACSASLDLETAFNSAFGELEMRVLLRTSGYRGEAISPKNVLTPIQHGAIFWQKKYFQKADRLFSSRKQMSFGDSAIHSSTDSDSLYLNVLSAGKSLAFVSLQPERCGVDQGRRMLPVCRALVPGLIPITFGFGREPLGMLKSITCGGFPHPFP